MKELMTVVRSWERMDRYSTVNRVYVGECAGSRSVGRSWKRGIDTVKEC